VEVQLLPISTHEAACGFAYPVAGCTLLASKVIAYQ
jgi:hypothetical protein